MDKNRLTDEQATVVAGGSASEDIIEASKAWLPDKTVQCSFCSSSFNARDNAYGFVDRLNLNTGIIVSVAVAKCPGCGMMWSQS